MCLTYIKMDKKSNFADSLKYFKVMIVPLFCQVLSYIMYKYIIDGFTYHVAFD